MGEEGKKSMEKEKTFQVGLKLHPEDWQTFWRKAMQHGLEPEEMLERFIADLTCGHGSGGSDEREIANNWYCRYFAMFDGETFLSWLCCDEGSLEEVINLKKHIRETEGYIAEAKEDIEKDKKYYESGHTYYYTAYKEDGTKYPVPIGWDENYNEHLENIAALQEELDYDLELLQELWEIFKKNSPYHTGTYEEEMAKIDEWIERYTKIAEENAEESQERTTDGEAGEPAEQANVPESGTKVDRG